jgi:hypothetical protein
MKAAPPKWLTELFGVTPEEDDQIVQKLRETPSLKEVIEGRDAEEQRGEGGE